MKKLVLRTKKGHNAINHINQELKRIEKKYNKLINENKIPEKEYELKYQFVDDIDACLEQYRQCLKYADFYPCITIKWN